MNYKRELSKATLEEIENLMWDLFTDIPHPWYDEEFAIDVQKAFNLKEVDVRPKWGGVPLSQEICKKHNIEVKKQIPVLNIYILKNAIINLLHRRDMGYAGNCPALRP